MVKKIPLLFIFLFFVSLTRLSAQISANDTVGCAPMIGVKFTGIPGSTNILWDFKDGNSSQLLNPTNTFALQGTYAVHYTATVAGSPVSQFVTIHVYGKPTPIFTASPPTKGCIPLTVSFASNSTGGGGTSIQTYAWTFGDGGSANNQNPTYTYTLAGQFDVQLKVTDQNGCDSSIKIQKYILTSKKPNAVIASNPASLTSCVAPFSVTFNGTGSSSNSTTSPTLTYSWIFSNGNTSTVVSPPKQTYSSTGVFPVTLTVTDNNNCSNSAVQNVNIGKPVATFSVKDTVCLTATFNPAGSTGAITWDYGDTQTGTANTHTYAAGGTYFVHLHTTLGACFNDSIKKIVVEDPKANFSILPSYSCSAPELIQFSNTSTGTVPGMTYAWTFATGSTKYKPSLAVSALAAPSVTISDQDTNRFTIDHKDVLLSVTLTITTPQGCKATLSKTKIDTIDIPTARIQPDVSRGCVPLKVAFSDSSISNEPIINWNYDFGDGTPKVNAVSSTVVSHTYNSPGVYQAKLIITNSRGCIDTSYVIVIYVGAPPSPNFTVSPTTVCPKTPVHFTNTSTSALNSPIDTWHYYTDNGFFMSSCYTDPNPVYSFGNSTGAQNITLVTCSRGCCDSIVKPGAITINGPLAHYTAKSDCSLPDLYTFTGDIKGATDWTWNFGDGTIITNSVANVIQHTYLATGNYLTKLIAHNNSSGCADDTFSLKIYVKHIKAKMITDTALCTNSAKLFNATPSVDVFNLGNNGYIWLWGDNTPPSISSSPIATHQFANSGFYYVKLIVTDENGCRDTAISKKIKASAVSANFKPDHFNGCIPWTVNFTSLATSDTTLTGWTWTFGDGSAAGSGAGPSHLYSNNVALSFPVFLTAKNILGCVDTITKFLVPSKPKAGFLASTTQKCAGDSILFTPSVGNDQGYQWSFGDGGTSTKVSPWYKYTKSGAYTVTLTVKDSIGCFQTLTQNNYISVQDYPKVGFTSSLDSSKNLCAPLVANFKDTTTASIFASRTWNFGNGAPVVGSQTVSTPYQLPGNDTVSLLVTTTFGCSSTIKKAYTILGPKAQFSESDSLICKGTKVTFQIKDTSEVYRYHWFFGDGFDTVGLSPISHVFDFHPAGGVDHVTLVYWSGDSTCKSVFQKQIAINQVISDFLRNEELTALKSATDSVHCLGSTDTFKNISSNATSFSWHFGDGGSSVSTSPSHKYLQAGTYTVSLDIKDAVTGCLDTLSKKMYVNPTPHALATGKDTCLGKPAQLTSSGGLTYVWSPSIGLSNTSIPNPIATPTVTTLYTVTVTDSNGCKDDTTALVIVIQPIPGITFDTSIVIGQGVPLNFNVSPVSNYTFVWSPTDSLSCKVCPNPKADPLVNTTYTLTVSDKKGCFSSTSTYEIIILPEASIDVPTAFTPNGDGVNDIVFVKGWGIKKLLEFSIYNRWGELVFRTDDINEGWNGYYKGVLQNVETYAWTANVETYLNGKHIQKKGFVKLLR
jgi:gliding motility-associated-like protein